MFDLIALSKVEVSEKKTRKSVRSSGSEVIIKNGSRAVQTRRHIPTQFIRTVSDPVLRSKLFKRDSRLDYRPVYLGLSGFDLNEYETRSVLGHSLYCFRGELIRSLIELYGASRIACFRASISQLIDFSIRFKARHDLKVCRNHGVSC